MSDKDKDKETTTKTFVQDVTHDAKAAIITAERW